MRLYLQETLALLLHRRGFGRADRLTVQVVGSGTGVGFTCWLVARPTDTVRRARRTTIVA